MWYVGERGCVPATCSPPEYMCFVKRDLDLYAKETCKKDLLRGEIHIYKYTSTNVCIYKYVYIHVYMYP